MEAIVPDADHKGYTITARHWEPASYIEAQKQKEEKPAKKTEARQSDFGMHLLIGSAAGFAVGAVATKKLLPIALLKFPQHAELFSLLEAHPLIVYFVTLVVSVVLVLAFHSGAPSEEKVAPLKKATSCMDIPTVGDNGRMVTVEEMKVGGSGSAAVMQGETVEVETIRTKYVVNAAGCYSVSAQLNRDNTSNYHWKRRYLSHSFLNVYQLGVAAAVCRP